MQRKYHSLMSFLRLHKQCKFSASHETGQIHVTVRRTTMRIKII